jgi:SNF2 family DNA or RNA helicase
MSHGVDGLQEAGRALIWHSLTWSLENFEQLNRRLHRSGQQERVTVFRIIAKRTIDEAIVKALDAKEKGQMGLLNALKDYWGK